MPQARKLDFSPQLTVAQCSTLRYKGMKCKHWTAHAPIAMKRSSILLLILLLPRTALASYCKSLVHLNCACAHSHETKLNPSSYSSSSSYSVSILLQKPCTFELRMRLLKSLLLHKIDKIKMAGTSRDISSVMTGAANNYNTRLDSSVRIKTRIRTGVT